MTNFSSSQTQREFIEALDDESIDQLLPFAVPLAAGDLLADLVKAEASRRAEIRLNRGMDAQYGPNPFGFTIDDVQAKHDAAWYASRQTEAQFLEEMGA